MSMHSKWNRRPRLLVLGAVTGVAMVLGGGFASQALASSVSAPGASGGGSAVVSPGSGSGSGSGSSGGGSVVVSPGSGSAGTGPVVSPGSGSAGTAPVVLTPGSAR